MANTGHACSGLPDPLVNTSISGTRPPKADTGRRAQVALYAHDVIVSRTLSGRQSVVRKRSVSTRGAITQRSAKSRNRLLHTLRNFPNARQWVVLTYPDVFPTDGETVKEHIAKLRKWLVKRGIGGLWSIEFQSRGAPHFNLILNGTVTQQEVSEKWASIVASGDERHQASGARVQAVYNEQGLASYISKAGQSHVPEDFQHIGRFWGLFGGVQIKPLETVSGPIEEVAPIIRAVKRVEQTQRARRSKDAPRRFDSGMVGFTSRGTSAAILPNLPALLSREPSS